MPTPSHSLRDSSASDLMASEKQSKLVTPRIILHGGAGNLTPTNLPPHLVQQHKHSLLSILRSTNHLLQSKHDTTAVDAACHAVSLLELDPLFNSGVGAVFTQAGTIELEASVIVSDPRSVKRGACVSHIKHVKSPVNLARELLLKGDEDPKHGGGAQSHVHLSGKPVESLAQKWGLEMCDVEYFWTRKRWEEHRRGMKDFESESDATPIESFEEDHYVTSHRPDGTVWASNDPTWDGKEYLPQGTVGCVVLDREGNIAVATSTGGVTNKLPGRVGDTPSFGCGFWAEEWLAEPEDTTLRLIAPPKTSPWESMMDNVSRVVGELDPFGFTESCLPSTRPGQQPYKRLMHDEDDDPDHDKSLEKRALGISGTGNGDSFLKLCAAHTASSLVRFASSPSPFPPMHPSTLPISSSPRSSTLPPTQPTLASALNWMAGPGGQLQQSARDRWNRTGEGQGGMIGIELVDGVGHVNYAFNCAGMFRAFVDNRGREHWGVWEDHEVSDEEQREGMECFRLSREVGRIKEEALSCAGTELRTRSEAGAEAEAEAATAPESGRIPSNLP
ncbi:MAG: hypothetical protein M1828_000662 [Chrysothrix sp. TS-e1954]|nr:MAG: hypothetical protein M1828_000662 [Chrysothrix sp. TS-e1954]